MPQAKVDGVDFYYEEAGTGEPLILIRGLGSNADHWHPQVVAFSPHFRVVTFDNRGIGRSGKPDVRYSISMMADDAVGILDGIGISGAHVLGLSMGGMIAQNIAIRYPEKVNALVLACTHCGGDHAIRAREEVRKNFADFIYNGSLEAGQNAVKSLFAEKTFTEAPEIFHRYQEVSRKFPPDLDTLRRQWDAIAAHDTWEDLPQIQAPTLILTGSEDAVIPAENSNLLAERIPNAQLKIFKGGGHQFLIEQADAFNRAVLDFLNPNTL